MTEEQQHLQVEEPQPYQSSSPGPSAVERPREPVDDDVAKEEKPPHSGKICGLPAQQCFCLVFILVLISLLFMIGATVAQTWSHFGTGDQKRVYGLMRCGDCPPGVAGTNWYCPMEIECHDNPGGGMCDLASDMYNAGNAYLTGQLPTFMLGVMLLERLLYACLNKDYGWSWIVYILNLMYPVSMIVSIILWFTSGDTSYSGSCDTIPSDPNAGIDICADDGGVVAIVATILSIIAGIVSTVVFCKRPEQKKVTGAGRASCFGVKNWMVMVLVLLFMLLMISLYVAAPAHEDWIRTEGHLGGLLKMKAWGPYINLGYDCIAEPRCAVDIANGSCATFRTLHEGSMVFIFFEVVAIYCWLLWFENVCYYLIGREYGIPLMNYITPVLSVILHTVGIVVWLTRSQAKFETTCGTRPEHADERWDVCGQTGPILAIINIGIGFVTVAFYTGVYMFRNKDVGVLKKLREIEGVELTNKG